jgi:hypothetical protein
MLRDGTAFVTPTAWAGETVLRICVVNPRTTVDDIAADLRLARLSGGTHHGPTCSSATPGCVATSTRKRRELPAAGWRSPAT